MSWYDTFSNFYDLAIESIYRPYRVQIAQALDPRPGQTVLIVACGTGQDFEQLQRRVGERGTIIGVDLSPGMLERARARSAKNGWTNVRLLERDAAALTLADLEALTEGPVQVDRLLFALALSVLPGWERVFDAAFDLLAPGGRCAIFDIYADRWVPQKWYVETIARADLSRQVWTGLERRAVNFRRTELEGSAHIHGGAPILAVGDAPGGAPPAGGED